MCKYIYIVCIILGFFNLIFGIVIKSMFVSVVAVAFQITFRVEIHVNNVFSFFKNHF